MLNVKRTSSSTPSHGFGHDNWGAPSMFVAPIGFLSALRIASYGLVRGQTQPIFADGCGMDADSEGPPR